MYDALNLSHSSSSEVRLSHRSRTLLPASSPSTSSFEDLSISPYSTIDVSFRLRGGGPKKRCAHVFVKASTSSASTSGAATPIAAATATSATADSAVTPSVEGEKVIAKEGEEMKAQEKEVEASGPVSAVPAISEPVLERCTSAALVSFTSLRFVRARLISRATITDFRSSYFSVCSQRMVGECPKCSKNFCGQHRLPEDHACPALQTFRKAAFDENMKRLNKEATFTSKISAF